jgi:hypothetical protein
MKSHEDHTDHYFDPRVGICAFLADRAIIEEKENVS